MKDSKDLELIYFKESDVELLTPIMKRAFDKDSQIHLNKESGGPPGYDNGDFLRKWALNKYSTAVKILFKKKPIGGVIIWVRSNNENSLGNIFIDPDYQNKGIGLEVWKRIESKYPATKIWKTETPGFSKRNHNFYINKCGFKVVKIENSGNLLEESYILEKEM